MIEWPHTFSRNGWTECTHSVHPFLKNVRSPEILCQSDKSGKADFAGIQAEQNSVNPFLGNEEFLLWLQILHFLTL